MSSSLSASLWTSMERKCPCNAWLAVEHLPATVMLDTPTAICRHGAVKNHQRTLRQERIAGILLGRNNEVERDFVILGIEVAGDGDEAGWVGVQQPLEQQASFEGLAGATHRGQEVSLRPAGNGLPHKGLELLPGNYGRKRRAQMQVDDRKHIPAGRFDMRDEHRAIKADGSRL